MKKRRPIKNTIIIFPLLLMSILLLMISLYMCFHGIFSNEGYHLNSLLFNIFRVLFLIFICIKLFEIYNHTFIHIMKDTINVSQMVISFVPSEWKNAGYHFFLKKESIQVTFRDIKIDDIQALYANKIVFLIKNGEKFLWKTEMYNKKQKNQIFAIINEKQSSIFIN